MTAGPVAIRLNTRLPSGLALERERDQTQAIFQTRARQLAHNLTTERIDLPTFQREMYTLITRYVVRQALLGAPDGRLTSDQVVALQVVIDRQAAYLSRFADSIGADVVEGKPLSEARIANRAASYAGAGRAEGYRAGLRPGTRVRYVAIDDSGTCGPCLAAEGEYDGGDPDLPLPGSVCLGMGNCRCVLEEV